MPIYEYLCSKGHQYERAESFDAPSEQSCPRCGAGSRRLISLPAVIFKGPGFYSTDNRKGWTGGNGGSGSGPPSAEPESSHDGGESKAAETAAAD